MVVFVPEPAPRHDTWKIGISISVAQGTEPESCLDPKIRQKHLHSMRRLETPYRVVRSIVRNQGSVDSMENQLAKRASG